MASQRETETLNRILDINWRQGDVTRRRSQLMLFDEYLRRAGIWSHALSWQEAHPIASDIPARIAPHIRATPVNTTLMQQSLRTLGKTSVYERMLLTRALNWAAIADHDIVVRHRLPDLYEPLLLFYERGGWLNKGEQESTWEISGVSDVIHRAHTYRDLPELELDLEHLNNLDKGLDD